MFKTFTIKSLASLALILAVTAVGAADSALASKKPGYWVRGQDGGFEWTGPRSTKPKDGQPTVRDHRGEEAGGGVTVMPDGPGRAKPKVRDHRLKPVVRDNRKKKKTYPWL